MESETHCTSTIVAPTHPLSGTQRINVNDHVYPPPPPSHLFLSSEPSKCQQNESCHIYSILNIESPDIDTDNVSTPSGTLSEKARRNHMNKGAQSSWNNTMNIIRTTRRSWHCKIWAVEACQAYRHLQNDKKHKGIWSQDQKDKARKWWLWQDVTCHCNCNKHKWLNGVTRTKYLIFPSRQRSPTFDDNAK